MVTNVSGCRRGRETDSRDRSSKQRCHFPAERRERESGNHSYHRPGRAHHPSSILLTNTDLAVERKWRMLLLLRENRATKFVGLRRLRSVWNVTRGNNLSSPCGKTYADAAGLELIDNCSKLNCRLINAPHSSFASQHIQSGKSEIQSEILQRQTNKRKNPLCKTVVSLKPQVTSSQFHSLPLPLSEDGGKSNVTKQGCNRM